MDIFETLRIEHAALSSLIDELIAKSTSPLESDDQQVEVGTYDWTDLFEELKLAIVADDRAGEAEVFGIMREFVHENEREAISSRFESLRDDIVEGVNPTPKADRSSIRRDSIYKALEFLKPEFLKLERLQQRTLSGGPDSSRGLRRTDEL